ncbi:MAG TPA: hypothetical protein PKB09_03340 [Candidatus Saccharibacteria bacterium]|nr:hypothetical protein [Candidatus Saccharibacteria bacterium]
MTNKIDQEPELTVNSARSLVAIALESALEHHPAIDEVRPEITIVPKVVTADLISGDGMREIGESESHLDFARALVEEAHRVIPEVSAEVVPIRLLTDSDNSQSALAA